MLNKRYRCNHCGRRSNYDMIRIDRFGKYQCPFCLKRGVTFILEMY